MTTWEAWAQDVLSELSATITTANVDALWAWSNAESGSDVMRWNNPLNTTEIWAGASHPMNSVGVQFYNTELIGARATVATLMNGDYPTIVANLRGSVPRQKWGTEACTELQTWGTGCGWLSATYSPAPTTLGGTFMGLTDTEQTELLQKVRDIYNAVGVGSADDTKLNQILAKLPTAPAPASEPAEPKTVTFTVPAVTVTGTLS